MFSLTTEQFTNEVINSIRYDKMMDLRKRYWPIDMLMIDDIQFLAMAMKSNVRELKGSLVRLGDYALLTGQIVSLEMAKNVLRDLIGDKKKIVAMDDIQEAVCAQFHVKMAELKSRRRSKTLVHPWQIAMYLCSELTDASYPEIGRHFGGKNARMLMQLSQPE